ncbi:sodium:solute symporter family protein [Alkalispirillum mobile]|uniref:Sodium:solute symporter family protein n=1 Tax=Alkalispirillum mobile TaxID=85925 RepID=A0A498C3X7_9GAMM|nr:sodium:solute symporter family protein [Alkalispirillum mobile]RLK50864.1 sodium:solute symporter family protein [Alkalispirillum mobile]
MEPKAIWLLVFVGLYWGYCIFWGIKGALATKTASDYFISGRSVPMWVFILAATATSWSGWTFVGHPGLLYMTGLQYGYIGLYAIGIPISGMLFLKRQWMIGRRWGFVTPGEMYSAYFRSNAIIWLVVIVATIFAIPYLGIQLRASGFLFNILTDGALGTNVGMWALSAIVLFYVASGGLRAVAYVDAMQCILLLFGMTAISFVAINYMGSIGDLSRAIAAASQWDLVTGGQEAGRPGLTPAGHSGYVATPGVIQWVSNVGDATGGAWTSVMVLSYMMSMAGIMASPSFTMWAFSNKDPRPFAPQQTWASALISGAVIVVLLAVQAMAGHGLGANTDLARDVHNPAYEETLGEYRDLYDTREDVVLQRGLIATFNPELSRDEVNQMIDDGLDALRAGEDPREASGWVDLRREGGGDTGLVPQLMGLLEGVAPWFVGLLAVCALGAFQSTGAAYMSTTSGIYTRDVLRRFINPNVSHNVQKQVGRIVVTILVFAALLVATFTTDALVLLGGTAVALGLQMWVPLIAVCYWSWLTRQGVVAGLIVGILAVLFTDNMGLALASTLGLDLPWGRWPLTIHSGGWGIVLNMGVAIAVSAFTQDARETEHKETFHKWLREHAGVPQDKRRLIPVAWGIVAVYYIFAIGPGNIIGTYLFGNPSDPSTWWVFGFPSIYAYQILCWLFGVFMMWFLCYKMEMSTVPKKEIEILYDEDAATTDADAGEPEPEPARS